MKIEIKNRWNDAVIYTHEADDASMCDAVLAAVLQGVSLRSADLRAADLRAADLSDADLIDANLSNANLSDANLSDANLRDANLSNANLSNANLSDANLSDANLRDANLTPIRDDIWAVLSSAPREVPDVIEALKTGRVDGSTYSGDCSCLVGTIGRARKKNIESLGSLKPNSSRPAERFFMAIRKGDKPETSQFSAIALQWCEEWLTTMREAFAEQRAE